MYTPRKAAQVAAFFASLQGGTIDGLKLVKLIYLADRESMQQFGFPITFDNYVSLENGPAVSTTANLISGYIAGTPKDIWEEWISDRANHKVELQRNFERSDLDELSEADIEIIRAIWSKFGKMDQWTLCKWTHDNCAEWKDPIAEGVGRIWIKDEDILSAVGKNQQDAARLADEIRAQRKLDRLFAVL
jgi:uncharacterized phage-associated protein